MTLKIRSAVLVVVVALLLPGCSALREKEPFQATVSYDLDQTGKLVVTPPEIVVPGRFGYVQVVNNTETRRNFDIDELAVFEGILPGRSKLVLVDEAENNKSYRFYDHTNPGTVSGLVITRYSNDEE